MLSSSWTRNYNKHENLVLFIKHWTQTERERETERERQTERERERERERESVWNERQTDSFTLTLSWLPHNVLLSQSYIIVHYSFWLSITKMTVEHNPQVWVLKSPYKSNITVFCTCSDRGMCMLKTSLFLGMKSVRSWAISPALTLTNCLACLKWRVTGSQLSMSTIWMEGTLPFRSGAGWSLCLRTDELSAENSTTDAWALPELSVLVLVAALLACCNKTNAHRHTHSHTHTHTHTHTHIHTCTHTHTSFLWLYSLVFIDASTKVTNSKVQ